MNQQSLQMIRSAMIVRLRSEHALEEIADLEGVYADVFTGQIDNFLAGLETGDLQEDMKGIAALSDTDLQRLFDVIDERQRQYDTGDSVMRDALTIRPGELLDRERAEKTGGAR